MRPFVVLAIAIMSLACSESNNVFLGRVQAEVAGHLVVVTDCYRTSVPAPRHEPSDSSERWTPCRDADLAIRGGELVVNGRSYGVLSRGDSVTVDHGRVLVNGKAAAEARTR